MMKKSAQARKGGMGMENRAVIVDAVRTPVGKMGKSLAGVSALELAAAAIRAVMGRTGIDPGQVDEVLFGNLLNYDNGSPARMAWLAAGMPLEVPGATVERRCASSLTCLSFAAALIESGHAQAVVAGGVDSYSQQPFLVQRPDRAYPAGLKLLEVKRAPDNIGDVSMIQTAENLAAQYHISREDCDAFALRSHRLAARAWSEGLFDRQVVPVTVPRRKGPPEQVRTDDCVRPGCTLEELARLKPVLGQGGVVTAGNSSPKNDGASAMLVLSERRAAEWGLKPLGRVAAFASAGCHPHYMGWGPVAATRKLLDQTGLRLADFDLIELNEAFAAQSLACLRELGLDNPADMERVNVNGGAIAIGHPNAASGGILTARILYELERRNARRGLITFCIGGGQGMSLVVERE